MSRTVENILGFAFLLAVGGATLDGMAIAKESPERGANIVGRCFSIPRNITLLPKQALACLHVPGIWTEQALIYGRN